MFYSASVRRLFRRQPLALCLIILAALFGGGLAQAQQPTPTNTPIPVTYSPRGLLSNVQVNVLGDNSVKMSWQYSWIYYWYYLEFINLTKGSDEIIRRSVYRNQYYQINDLRPGTDYKVVLRMQPYWYRPRN